MKRKFPYFWGMKIHGHEMQASSIPDFLFSINGKFVAIEFKIQRDGKISITRLQVRELEKIKNSNGIALIIAYDENNHKILIRERRYDWRRINKKYIRIDWDFEYSRYEHAINLIEVMVS
jgi:Holliday junction resolvase